MKRQTLRQLANEDGVIPIQKDNLPNNRPATTPQTPNTTKKIINDNRFAIPQIKQAVWIYLMWAVLLLLMAIGLWFWLIGAPDLQQEVDQKIKSTGLPPSVERIVDAI